MLSPKVTHEYRPSVHTAARKIKHLACIALIAILGAPCLTGAQEHENRNPTNEKNHESTMIDPTLTGLWETVSIMRRGKKPPVELKTLACTDRPGFKDGLWFEKQCKPQITAQKGVCTIQGMYEEHTVTYTGNFSSEIH
ncbi:MAG TPA: hypothetical protein VL381_07620, partial [Rhodocyclaceae bacterium]|nr:hypothetical protein [Rhodocyclaceae bacterium]